MSHELHRALDDLVQGVATEHEAGAGLPVAAMTARARSRRVRFTALVSTAAACAVLAVGAGGVAVATWDRAEVQPAVPTPTASSTPTPEVTQPAPAPSSDPTPDAADGADLPAVTTSGVVRPYPTAPTVGWTLTGADLGGPQHQQTPVVGDVTASPHQFPGFRALEAGGAWLVAVLGDADRMTAVDTGSGAPRWTWTDDGAPGSVVQCGGTHDGLLVCLVRTADATEVQLRDPATGTVVRTVAPGGVGTVVVGDTLLVHDLDGDDVHVRFHDLRTGALRSSSTLTGVVDPDEPVGDGVVFWQRSGALVLVHGVGYSLAVDMASAQVLGDSLAIATGVRGDGWVHGTAADGTVLAVDADGREVVLPGTTTWTPSVWAPDPDVAVPLLSGSDEYDDVADSVQATDPATGATLWTVPDAYGALAVAGRTAVLGSGSGLVGVDLTSGTVLWRTEFGAVTAFDGERLLLSRSGRSWAVAADGTEAWTLTTGPEVELQVVGDELAHVSWDATLSGLVP